VCGATSRSRQRRLYILCNHQAPPKKLDDGQHGRSRTSNNYIEIGAAIAPGKLTLGSGSRSLAEVALPSPMGIYLHVSVELDR
jgi:hypothetical protein